ncbi:MAG: retroviral-like aspartic protease [Planctomycetes bacterium]|nr:retroviral-like aspartic protease [Planctomycetota bacterium]
MPEAERFSFVEMRPYLGEASRLPFLPITLSLRGRSISVSGLLDTGSAVNVLPYDVGLQLGAVWEQQEIPVRLSGSLAGEEARALVLSAVVKGFPSVRLAFAWTRSNVVPVVLGQINFFLEFDVCFFRARSMFEVRPRVPSQR